ncbi:hypothetical protein AOLI_G00204960 [Acnodon oligacanthus]
MWKVLEDGLNRDVGILADYLQKWHLQLNLGKTVAAPYHLNNREARRPLHVYVGKNCLEFQQATKYLGVRLDQTLSYKHHLEEVKAKVIARSLAYPPLGWIKLGSFPPDPSHIHASPCPTVPLPGAEVHMWKLASLTWDQRRGCGCMALSWPSDEI